MEESKQEDNGEALSLEYRENKDDPNALSQVNSPQDSFDTLFQADGTTIPINDPTTPTNNDRSRSRPSAVLGEASKRLKSSLKITRGKMNEHIKRGSEQLQELGTNLKAHSEQVKKNIQVVQQQADQHAASLLPQVSLRKKTDQSQSETKGPNPMAILSSEYCKAHSLTVSDQHATLLLSHSPLKQDTEMDESMEVPTPPTTVKSILKLQVQPFHKSILGSNPVLKPNDPIHPERNTIEQDASASQNIISFLKDYKYELKSESGAEYSYYQANPSSNGFVVDPKRLLEDAVTSAKTLTSVIRKKNDDTVEKAEATHWPIPGSFHVELISPATERQIQRVMPSPGFAMIQETPQIYNEVTKPFIQTILDGNSTGWIKNVIEGKKEKERLLLDKETYILNIDTKWRSHPDPLTVPRAEWKNNEATKDLYCLGITKCPGIASIRDLTPEHVPMLESMIRDGCNAIEEIYGVKSNQIRVFAHYQPQFYWFHVHYTRLENEVGTQVERGHLVTDIIQNLQIDPQYYEKRSISYKLQISSPLYQQIEEFAAQESVQ